MSMDGGFVIDPPARAEIGENVGAVDVPTILARAVTHGVVEPPADNNT